MKNIISYEVSKQSSNKRISKLQALTKTYISNTCSLQNTSECVAKVFRKVCVKYKSEPIDSMGDITILKQL